MDSVTLTIDGRSVTVEKGTTVLQAAIAAGSPVPYYCYHPGISIDGSCRVCIVKIEKMPKLQTSCSTVCTDGMVVSTVDPEVAEARAGIFEFLLINHPLDCPVCDKGGECPLQDFSYTYGPAESRMDFPRRVFDGEGAKADVDFGPTLMLNRNRCILCTRCVRFMKEVEGDAQINIVDRGNGSEIATFREEGVHSVLSGNLMDVCPVGAITTRDYRFKSRPWDNPSVTDTICTRCSKGCSTNTWLKGKPEWAKGSQIVRMTPRYNPDVNGYWMCDIGRFGYHWIESDTRLRRPLRRLGAELEAVTWQDIEAPLADGLRAAAEHGALRFLVSAHSAIEELFVLKALLEQVPGAGGLASTSVAWTRSEKAQPGSTQFRVADADAPNVHGARDLGYAVGAANEGDADLSTLRSAVEAGTVKAVYVVDPGPDGSLGDLSWIVDARRNGRLPFLVVQGVVMHELTASADLVLPGASTAEKNALYTNDQGHVQASTAAIAPLGEAREDWRILTDIAASLGAKLPYTSAADVRQALAATMPNSNYSRIDQRTFAGPVKTSTWLQSSNPSERWKWDFMFKDLPPVKGYSVQTDNPPPSPVIPLKPVT
jgi:NADH-quinone oxidoreductase subunit G